MKFFTAKQTGLVSIAAILLAACSGPSTHTKTEENTVDKQAAISVSGLSSGAYMALQFHLAHSEKVVGSGLIAAGPYFCAQGSIGTALQDCVANPDANINLKVMSDTIVQYQKDGKLAAPKYNQNDKVWLLHGTLDTRIIRPVAEKLAEQVSTIFGPSNTRYISDKAFSHVMPTLNSGTDCTESSSPFIGNCQ